MGLSCIFSIFLRFMPKIGKKCPFCRDTSSRYLIQKYIFFIRFVLQKAQKALLCQIYIYSSQIISQTPMVSKVNQDIISFTHFWHGTILLSIFAYFSRIFHLIPLFSDLKVYFSRRGGFLSWYGTYNTQNPVYSPIKAPCNFF